MKRGTWSPAYTKNLKELTLILELCSKVVDEQLMEAAYS